MNIHTTNKIEYRMHAIFYMSEGLVLCKLLVRI